MNRFTHLLSLLLIASLLTGCKDDFELYEDYQDITQVVGTVTSGKGRTYVKIAKAFGGPGNAYESAAQPDSSQYNYKLDATLIEMENRGGNFVEIRRLKLDTTTIHNKDKGVFYAPNQTVYYVDDSIKGEHKYKLEIKKKNGEVVDATVYMPKPPKTRLNSKYITMDKDNVITLSYTPYEVAPTISVWLKFRFKELNVSTNKWKNRDIVWEIATSKIDNMVEGTQYNIGFIPRGFWKLLEEQVKPDPNIIREFGHLGEANYSCMEVITYSGDNNIYFYELSNDGKMSLLQSTKAYTNINNGFGVFGSVSKDVIKRYISRGAHDRIINDYPELNFRLPIGK